jgi:hypothetical protein
MLTEDELVELMLDGYYIETNGTKGRMRRVVRLLKKKGLLQVKEEASEAELRAAESKA